MPAAQPYSLNGMARRLGIGYGWVLKYKEPQFEPDADGCYSIVCWQKLQARHEAFMRLPEIGDMMTLGVAAKVLLCSRQHLLKLVETHDLPLVTCRTLPRRVVSAVPDATMRELAILLPEFAPKDMSTIEDLRWKTHWSHAYVTTHLAASAVPRGTFRCVSNGHLLLHYRRTQAVALLGYKPLDIPATGNHLTAGAIEKLLGRPDGWARRRLSRADLRSQATFMLDGSGAIRLHYPYKVYLSLKIESDYIRRKQAA